MAELPWKPVVHLPANLTVRFDAEVLRAWDPQPWCEGKAADLLGAGARRGHVQRLVATLMRYTETLKRLDGRELPSVAALFFWADFDAQRATAEVYVLPDDRADGPMAVARARELTAPNKDSQGEPETAELQVPAGRAFRAHQFRKPRGALAPDNVTEAVSWFIWPTDSGATVVITVSWLDRIFSEAGITIADDMARNFHLEPLAPA